MSGAATETRNAESALELRPVEPLLTRAEWAAMLRNPVLSQLHYETELGDHIRDYLSWMRNERNRAEITCSGYEHDLAKLALMFPAHTPEQFTKHDLRAGRDTYPLLSRGRVMSVYRSFFRYLYREERVTRNVAELIDMPKPRAREAHEVYTEAEVARIIKSGPDNSLGRSVAVRDKVLLLLLLDAGLRRSELIALRVRDVDLAERVVIVRHGKGDKLRLVPFAADDRLDRALRTFLSTPLPRIGRLPEEHDHFLFAIRVNQYGISQVTPDKAVCVSTFHGWHKRCLERATVRYRKPHMTRHTFGTEHVRRSGAERTRLLMGHASIQTTVDEYGHLNVTDAREAVESLAEQRRERKKKEASG